MTYLITFSTYGSHLHGEERGSVDRVHNRVGGPMVETSAPLRGYKEHLMTQASYVLSSERRGIVLQAMIDVCEFRGWHLEAAHVRTNHVHVVVGSSAQARKIALDFKKYASRALNNAVVDAPDRKRWSRGFSARYLADRRSIDAAVRYVAEKQGVPMNSFVAAR